MLYEVITVWNVIPSALELQNGTLVLVPYSEGPSTDSAAEDVTEIILNLKGLTAKMYGDGPKTIYIESEGECEVCAGDIKTDSEVRITSYNVCYTKLLRVPFLDPTALQTMLSENGGGGFLKYLDIISGGSFSNSTIFALSVV